MKITKSYLKQIIKEEIEKLEETEPVSGRLGDIYVDSGDNIKTYTGEKMPGAQTLFSTSVIQLRRLVMDIADNKELSKEEIKSRLEQITRNLETQEARPPAGLVSKK